MIAQQHTIPRPLSADALAAIGSVAEACGVLRGWGRDDLAERIAWFASDADLDEGDVPLTLDSALGFLAFFGAVASEGRVELGCSPEGWICAEWDFSDNRDVGLWFLDRNRIMYTARNSSGRFLDFGCDGNIGDGLTITENLVKSELFQWYTGSPPPARFPLRTTQPATAAPG